MSALISAAELKTLKGAKILDASYNLPPLPAGIAGAMDFDIDAIADPKAPFLHTVPSPELFAEKVGGLGISNNDTVVVYDRMGLAMAAARAWWMFRLFGHDNVKILNGGLPAWVAAGGALTEKAKAAAPAHFTPHFRPALLKEMSQMLANIPQQDFTVIDARDSKRFGDGHIPGSLSAPYASLVTSDGALKPKNELETIFKNARLDMNRKIACTCGSGVTACVIALALYELGHKDAAVYDGSWTEWGASASTPKEQGSAAA